jgi:hypothetical protein
MILHDDGLGNLCDADYPNANGVDPVTPLDFAYLAGSCQDPNDLRPLAHFAQHWPTPCPPDPSGRSMPGTRKSQIMGWNDSRAGQSQRVARTRPRPCPAHPQAQAPCLPCRPTQSTGGTRPSRLNITLAGSEAGSYSE